MGNILPDPDCSPTYYWSVSYYSDPYDEWGMPKKNHPLFSMPEEITDKIMQEEPIKDAESFQAFAEKIVNESDLSQEIKDQIIKSIRDYAKVADLIPIYDISQDTE